MMLESRSLNLNRAEVMAIINLTPDSFYVASRNLMSDEVARSVERAIVEGASIVDLGGYSSRPGAEDVALEEEWRRVRMGLEAVRSVDGGVVVSIDTFRSEVVRRAYEEFGDFVVNDISAGELDGDMLKIVARYGLTYVAMHMRGVPQTMSSLNHYDDGVVEGVKSYFATRVKELEAAGIAKSRIILDPGFGFAKSPKQNYELLTSLDSINELGYPLLVGLSRKSMIYKPLGLEAEQALPGSLAFAWESLRGGARIIRAHDVAPTRQIVDLYNYYNSQSND
jgi:dihydropteroate synthase